MESSEGKGKICVTGGTGFIASWIIKRLLEDGYSVNTTIRSDPGRKRDLSFLTILPGAAQKLKFFNADLSDPESFKDAIEGCVGVFHTATPVDFEENESEEVVTRRTIEGALGILRACVRSNTVKRVVYMSSASAVIHNNKNDDVMDESFWSDVDFLRSVKPFAWTYAVSKTLAEKAVLEFGERNGLQVVSLMPSFVVGPFICPKIPGSVHLSLSLVFGEKDQYGLILRAHMVHVDDVARAHIFLLEHPNPKGRYNCSPFIVSIEDMSELLSAKHPEFQIPSKESLKEIKGYKLPDLCSKKLMDAGFEFKYGLEQTFDDAIQCCKEKGYL
ncbi:vestitone reductase-like isoform X2 [Prosopis cineraria]|uniref:vestitone reductase-like isoform X2 n=1 Tax=Prosopis cineraria TaxID=364024 RepID=UPI002410127B|nr:vestitone reductase-like isoform X2 [Prosopis cineraria]